MANLISWAEFGVYSQGSERPVAGFKGLGHRELIHSSRRSFWLQKLDKNGDRK